MYSNLREISNGLYSKRDLSEKLALFEVIKDTAPAIKKASLALKWPEPEFEDIALVDH